MAQKNDGVRELMGAALAASGEEIEAALAALRGEPQRAAKPSVEPFITLKALGKEIGFHPVTLWRWKIPSHDLGGRPRFLISEVRVYLESLAFRERAAALKAERRQKAILSPVHKDECRDALGSNRETVGHE